MKRKYFQDITIIFFLMMTKVSILLTKKHIFHPHQNLFYSNIGFVLFNNGDIIPNKSNNSLFLHPKTYWNRQVFGFISGYCLEDQSKIHTVPDNPQQILAYSWYIFRSFIIGILYPFLKSKIPLVTAAGFQITTT